LRQAIFQKNFQNPLTQRIVNAIIQSEQCSVRRRRVNTIVTSKEEILKASRELIRQEGWSDISIRSVAAACGVSVGSIYNYFDSKTELVSATVESVWEEIFHRPENADMFQNIVSCITWMFERMAYGSRQYPGFFTLHSLSFMQKEKSEGKLRMQHAWQHILDVLCFVLKQDAGIRQDAFTDDFTAEKLANVLFSLMLSALLREDYDPSAILEIVRRLLY
jgi:hypothetical protein